MNHWIIDRLTQFKRQLAFLSATEECTYGQLLERVAYWQGQLCAHDVEGGACVAMIGDYSSESTALLIALIVNGNVVVPIAQSLPEIQKQEFMTTACVDIVVRFGACDDWSMVPRKKTATHRLLEQLRQDGEPGLILFSSGSTGMSKASVLNFNKILNKFRNKGKPYRSLVFLLIDHIGGINTLFYLLSSGGTAISITERNPREICRAVEFYRVQLLPTTPTFLNMLMISGIYRDYDLRSLEIITYGTEPMPISTLMALNETFPTIRFKQTYGLSEIGIPKTHSRDSDSLWFKIVGDDIESKIVGGILWVRAESAMLGYLNAESPFDEDGWFNTGDQVVTDGEYIRVLGRASEIINVGGEKVYPAEVEDVLLQMENIKEVVVSGKANPITGNVVMARATLGEPEDVFMLHKRVRAFCQDRLASYKIPVFIEIAQESLHNARFKKQRV